MYTTKWLTRIVANILSMYLYHMGLPDNYEFSMGFAKFKYIYIYIFLNNQRTFCIIHTIEERIEHNSHAL